MFVIKYKENGEMELRKINSPAYEALGELPEDTPEEIMNAMVEKAVAEMKWELGLPPDYPISKDSEMLIKAIEDDIKNGKFPF